VFLVALTDRQRRIIERAVDMISRESTPTGEVEASLHALRRIMAERKIGLAELIGAATGSAAVEEIAAERDQWRRRARQLERQLAERTAAANAARAEAADSYAKEVARIIKAIIREEKNISSDGIAAELERRGVKTPGGSKQWTRMQVHRVMQRAGEW
jgi:hypothetical protein